MEALRLFQAVKMLVPYYRDLRYRMVMVTMKTLMGMVLTIPTEEGFTVKTVTRPFETASLEITLQMKEVGEEYSAMSHRPLLLAVQSLVMRPTMLVEVSTLGHLQALRFMIVFSMIT